jgi:hypothetical protein
MKLSAEQTELLQDFLSNGGVRALEIAFQGQVEALERAVLDCKCKSREDEYILAARRNELEGGRKAAQGVLAFLNSLRGVTR